MEQIKIWKKIAEPFFEDCFQELVFGVRHLSRFQLKTKRRNVTDDVLIQSFKHTELQHTYEMYLML